MRRCPECRRNYYDETLLYCLDDGTAFLEGPASMDESATAILHDTDASGGAATRLLDPHALCDSGLRANPGDQDMLQQIGIAYARSGHTAKAEEVMKRFKDLEKVGYVGSYNAATVYAAMGQRDAAFSELEKAYQTRDFRLHRLKVDPQWDPIRDDPRHRDFLKRYPECRRNYYDETLLYCLDDGTALLEGPGTVEQPTAIISGGNESRNRVTERFARTTVDPSMLRISHDAYPGRQDRRNKSNSLIAAAAIIATLAATGFLIYRYQAVVKGSPRFWKGLYLSTRMRLRSCPNRLRWFWVQLSRRIGHPPRRTFRGRRRGRIRGCDHDHCFR